MKIMCFLGSCVYTHLSVTCPDVLAFLGYMTHSSRVLILKIMQLCHKNITVFGWLIVVATITSSKENPAVTMRRQLLSRGGY